MGQLSRKLKALVQRRKILERCWKCETVELNVIKDCCEQVLKERKERGIK